MSTANIPLRNIALSAINDAFDGGTLRFYSGGKPATANLAPTGTLIAEMTAADVFAAVSNGSMGLNDELEDTEADNAGTIGYARFAGAGDTNALDANFPRLDMTVTATGGGGELEVDNTVVAAGQAVRITALTVTWPAGT